MSLFGKLEAEAEAKAPDYKFHEVNSKKISESVKICPKFFQRLDLQEGECLNGEKWALSCAGIFSLVSQPCFFFF